MGTLTSRKARAVAANVQPRSLVRSHRYPCMVGAAFVAICVNAFCANGAESTEPVEGNLTPRSAEVGAGKSAIHGEDEESPNAGRIIIDAGTRASLNIQIDPTVAARLRLPESISMSLGSSVTEAIAPRLRARGMDPGIFNVGMPVPDRDGNVMIRLFIGSGGGAQSYHMRLLARQGRAVWSASLDRPSGRHPDLRQMASEEGEPMGNPVYDSLLMDGRELGRRLGEALEFKEVGRD